jgi:hypothetical protein
LNGAVFWNSPKRVVDVTAGIHLNGEKECP